MIFVDNNEQDVAKGTNCKDNEFVLANECSVANCPADLPDWSGSNGNDNNNDGNNNNNNNNNGNGNGENAGVDEATKQFRLKTTDHGK